VDTVFSRARLTGIRFARRGPPLRAALALAAACALAACKSELYSNLDQDHANEMVAVLRQHGIPAERVPGKGDRISVAVDENRFAEAVQVLKDNGLPRQEFATLGDVFKKDGLVSSPIQEKAQLIFALSQELSRTVSEIDGVLSARVHLVLPENDPLRQQLVPSSASVFIRHRASAPIGDLVPQVKMLIARGVSGLSYEQVSVILVPVSEHVSAPQHDTERAENVGRLRDVSAAGWTLVSLAALAVVAALIGGMRRWFGGARGRMRSYPVTSDAAKPR